MEETNTPRIFDTTVLIIIVLIIVGIFAAIYVYYTKQIEFKEKVQIANYNEKIIPREKNEISTSEILTIINNVDNENLKVRSDQELEQLKELNRKKAQQETSILPINEGKKENVDVKNDQNDKEDKEQFQKDVENTFIPKTNIVLKIYNDKYIPGKDQPKFLEIPMKNILNLGYSKFAKTFRDTTFKLTDVQYDKEGYVSLLVFEENRQ